MNTWQYLCEGQYSLRKQILSRFVGFARQLGQSPSKEVRLMFQLVKEDKRSVTARNLTYLNRICKCNTLNFTSWKVKELLPRAKECEQWRTRLLTTLLDARINRQYQHLNLQKYGVEEMIKSLCIS